MGFEDLHELSRTVSLKRQSDKIFDHWRSIIFIAVNEWHWTQSDIEEVDIPFLLLCLDARRDYIAEQERQARKRR